MKKRTLTLLTIAFGLCFLIFACRREINNITTGGQPNVPQTLLESAKILNSKTLGDNAAINSKTPGFFTLQPQWNNASVMTMDNGTKVLVVPTIENQVSNRSVNVRRVYLFESSGGRVTSGHIVEFIGLDYAVTPKLETLI